MKTYLVTGAAGFIGSAITRQLIAHGNTVVTIDNLSTGKIDNIPSGCIFIEGDVFDSKIINELNTYSFDAILHIAGQSSGEVSFENPVYDLQTNTQSTVSLLNYAKNKHCSQFIYASSMSVFGDHDPPFVSENSPTMPKSFYAVGKLASENYMRIYNTFGIKCTALRFFNVYGIGQNLENLKQGMASIYLAMALQNKKIIVKGSKDRFRDFIYIDDVVDAVNLVLNQQVPSQFNIYNVCTGKKTTVEQVIECIKNELAIPIDVEYVSGTPGDQHGIYGDNEKIKRELGWAPKYSFEQGMKLMVQWALS
jgi:UDP-glucose 4-epimerase